jgi:hypothetical protein
VQAWRRQAFFALSNSTQVLLEPQRSVLPGTPITAPAGASNGRFQVQKICEMWRWHLFVKRQLLWY